MVTTECQRKTGLKICVDVYQKKAWLAAALSIHGKTPAIDSRSEDNSIQFYSVCHTKRRLGLAGPRASKAIFAQAQPSFLWYKTYKDL